MNKSMTPDGLPKGLHWQQVAVALCSAVVILLVLTGALYCWEYGDDYLNKVGMAGMNPIQYSWDLYLTHDGRHMSPAGFIQMSFVKFLTAPPAVVMYVILLVLSAFIMLNMLVKDISKGRAKSSLTSVLAFSAVICIGLWPLFKDVLYWLTGGYYLLSLLQAVLLALVCFRYMGKRDIYSSGGKLGIALLVFLLSLNSQNVMLPLAAVMGVYLLYTLYKQRKIDVDFLIVIVLPAFAAMLVTNLAPGNFARLHREQPGTEHLGAMSYIKTIALMYFRFFNYAKIGLLGGFAFGMLMAPYYTGKARSNSEEHSSIYLKRSFQFFALAIISVIPFMLAPALARIRVYFYGMLFLIIAGCYAGIYLRQWKGQWLHRFAAVPAMGFLLYGIVFFYGQLKVMIPFSNKIAERKAYLETQRGSKAKVLYPLLEMPGNLHLIRWADAKYYGDWNKTKEFFDLGGYSEVAPNGDIIPGDIPLQNKP